MSVSSGIVLLNDPLYLAIMAEWPDATVFVGRKHAVEFSEQEINAVMAASPVAGAHLEAMGKTDLAAMSEDEWHGFLACVVMAYADSMAAQHAPYAVLRSKDDPQLPIEASEVPY